MKRDTELLLEIIGRCEGTYKYLQDGDIYYIELRDEDEKVFHISNEHELLLECLITEGYFIGYDLVNECEFSCTDIKSLLDFNWRKH